MEKRFRMNRDSLAAYAFANCMMILENAITMPDDYIIGSYGSDSAMCDVAEKYFDLGVKIMNGMPDIKVSSLTAFFGDVEDFIEYHDSTTDCINVGDEVRSKDTGETMVVTRDAEDRVIGFDQTGMLRLWETAGIEHTGRTFTAVGRILDVLDRG